MGLNLQKLKVIFLKNFDKHKFDFLYFDKYDNQFFFYLIINFGYFFSINYYKFYFKVTFYFNYIKLFNQFVMIIMNEFY